MEKVITLPLNGQEIRTAILDRLSQRLMKDGYLNEALAYDYFWAGIKIEIRAHDCGRECPVDINEIIATPGMPTQELEVHEGEFEIEPQPPNEVRVETGQPVPVLTRSGDGQPEVKHIKYKRGAAKPKE